ncbi:hypothetical protein BU25DRAFT_346254, partial [Macroventuria anomochaeta]
LTSYLTNLNSIYRSLTHALIKLLPGVGVSDSHLGNGYPWKPSQQILDLFWTFGAPGAASAAGQAMVSAESLDNDHPRKHVNNLDGLPLRLRSAHYALMENFLDTPIRLMGCKRFALTAALAQVLAPNDAQIVNLLGFHVIAKLLVHYPAYLGNIALPRTLAHISATIALIDVGWRLATGA